MGRGGGATKREGGEHVKFYPYGKERGGESISHIEGGAWGGGGGGGQNKFQLFKGGGGVQNVLPCLDGGGAQTFSDPQLSHFVAPPPRN